MPIDPEVKELLDYLEEVLQEYEKYVLNIGNNGLAASLLLNYRDEVQDTLDDLRGDDVPLTEYWKKVVELDNIVRKNARELVREVGPANFKQYQIINDPPKTRWWWYLDRTTPDVSGIPPAPKPWEIWRR